jgi:tetratricopeptide (TPR) repeat protein
VRLFVERARAARADFELSEANAVAVAELCLRLDGLPLPLELAAARIKLLSLRAMLERLGRSLELLKAEPGAGVPERHRTLRAAIEWSYDLLGAEEQALFRSLAVLVGGFTLAGAEAVAGKVQLDIVDGVESLLSNSLLRTERMAGDEPRFGMLETIREYALERLAESAEGDVVRRRHADFYLALAEEAEPGLRGPQQLSWLERVDAERDNLRASLAWSTESGETDVGLRTGAALWRFWHMRGSQTEGRERLGRLLAGRSGSSAARAGAQSAAASLANVQGDHDAVRQLLEASLPVHRSLGDDRRVATSLCILGSSALATGDSSRARAFTQEGLEVARRTGDLTIEAMLLFNVGLVLAGRGELAEAEDAIGESVRIMRQLGNVRSVGDGVRALGSIALARGDYTQARPRFEESLAVGRTLGDPWGTAHSLSNLALVAQQEHDHDTARRLLAESLTIEQEAGDRLGMAANLEVFATLADAESHLTRSARLHGCASVLRESVGFDPCEPGWPDPAQQISRLRSTLGEEAFAELWARGRAMTTADSIAYALEEGADHEPT